jgi:hypothetical protein
MNQVAVRTWRVLEIRFGQGQHGRPWLGHDVMILNGYGARSRVEGSEESSETTGSAKAVFPATDYAIDDERLATLTTVYFAHLGLLDGVEVE